MHEFQTIEEKISYLTYLKSINFENIDLVMNNFFLFNNKKKCLALLQSP